MKNTDKLIADINKFADQKIKETKRDVSVIKGMVFDYLGQEACTLKNWHVAAWILITILFCSSTSI